MHRLHFNRDGDVPGFLSGAGEDLADRDCPAGGDANRGVFGRDPNAGQHEPESSDDAVDRVSVRYAKRDRTGQPDGCANGGRDRWRVPGRNLDVTELPGEDDSADESG